MRKFAPAFGPSFVFTGYIRIKKMYEVTPLASRTRRLDTDEGSGGGSRHTACRATIDLFAVIFKNRKAKHDGIARGHGLI